MKLRRVLIAPIFLACAALACGSDPVDPTPTSVTLTAGATTSLLVNAAAGGSVTVGGLALEIPPGALDKDTTITITQLGNPEYGAFSLQPEGTKFKIPAVAHYTIAPAVMARIPVGAPIGGIAGFYDDAGTTAEYVGTTPDGSEADHLRVPVPHFTAIAFYVAADTTTTVTPLTPNPVNAKVGEEFGVVASYQLQQSDVTVSLSYQFPGENTVRDYEPVGGENGTAQITGAVVTATSILGASTSVSVVDTSPPSQGTGFVSTPIAPPEAVTATESIVKGAVFQCRSVGKSSVFEWLALRVSGTVVVRGFRLERLPANDGSYVIKSKTGQTTLPISLTFNTHAPPTSVNCAAETAALNSLGLVGTDRDKIPPRHLARTALAYDDSVGKKKVTPTPGTAINAAQDPLLTVGPGAAARLTTQFPCGDGPKGKTVCGTAGPFTPGDYVMLVSDFDADIPLADPTWRYQHAFVFDADGIASNNYVPPAQYPKDFFGGTDKWFQLFYEPGKGWSVKVVDARISNVNPVTSAARFVIAGRELAIFIPRAELNGAAPTFRVTTFRHQGDYGLNGGPSDLSYFPLLGAPLLPAQVGPAIVLPE